MSNHRDDLMYSGDAATLVGLCAQARSLGLVIEIYNEPRKPLMPLYVVLHHNGKHLISESFHSDFNANVWLRKQLNDFNSWR